MNNYNPYGEQLSWLPASDQHSYDAGSGQRYYHYPLNSQQGKIDTTKKAAKPSYNSQQQEPRPLSRMPKEQALSLSSRLKKISLVASIALFGLLSGIIATHMHGSISQATSAPLPSHELPSQPADQANPSDPNADSGGFFGHHHRDGYGFGNGDNNGSGGPSQQPGTGTGVSRR